MNETLIQIQLAVTETLSSAFQRNLKLIIILPESFFFTHSANSHVRIVIACKTAAHVYHTSHSAILNCMFCKLLHI